MAGKEQKGFSGVMTMSFLDLGAGHVGVLSVVNEL